MRKIILISSLALTLPAFAKTDIQTSQNPSLKEPTKITNTKNTKKPWWKCDFTKDGDCDQKLTEKCHQDSFHNQHKELCKKLCQYHALGEPCE